MWDCGTAPDNLCCNDSGLFASFCYGNVACQSGGQGGLFYGTCETGVGVDSVTGCCSNYAASGIRGKTTLLSLYIALH